MTSHDRLPVAVIGAGPVGLAAAAQLLDRDLPVKVYEVGPTVASSVRDWGHDAFSKKLANHKAAVALYVAQTIFAGCMRRCG
jgi:NADPH-dependent 2,4-dienoyl-CoA reductase/sulfur reductase-like enzyme